MPGAKTRKVGKKQMKAMKKSNNVAKTLKNALKKGNNVGEMMLAKVVSVSGGGRFVVKDLDGKLHHVRVSKTLFAKAARHRNATMPTAVHVDSNVIVDAGVIRSVIGDAEAKALKSLLKVESKNTNSLFSHSTRSSKGSKSSKGSRKSSKGSVRSKKGAKSVSLSNL
jgi:hypothetical protein